MMGYDFALALQRYMNLPENSTRYNRNVNADGAESSNSSNSSSTPEEWKRKSIVLVKANPSKSKHLETCNCSFCGFSIDFVNLRAETYTKDSRIPNKITFGTPLQDAQRRDCTINSMFYNISTESVEDLTGMGLVDLQNGIIRTPLDPDTTFDDDPLRVLRAVRFAARFDFTLDENLANSASVRFFFTLKIFFFGDT
jgi:Poly A polymerase head domain